MYKFTAKFTRQNLDNLRADLQAVLDKYGASANLEFSIGNLAFTPEGGTIPVRTKIIGVKTVAEQMLEEEVQRLGLQMEKDGARLIRYDASKHKYPFIYELNGKQYKCDEFCAVRRFKASGVRS